MFIKNLIFIFLIIIFQAGCTSAEKARKATDAKEDALFNKWINHSKSELVQAWGTPDSILPNKRGGQILIYKEGVDFKSVMNERYTGKQISFRKEIFINADSIIYYWRASRRK